MLSDVSIEFRVSVCDVIESPMFPFGNVAQEGGDVGVRTLNDAVCFGAGDDDASGGEDEKDDIEGRISKDEPRKELRFVGGFLFKVTVDVVKVQWSRNRGGSDHILDGEPIDVDVEVHFLLEDVDIFQDGKACFIEAFGPGADNFSASEVEDGTTRVFQTKGDGRKASGVIFAKG